MSIFTRHNKDNRILDYKGDLFEKMLNLHLESSDGQYDACVFEEKGINYSKLHT